MSAVSLIHGINTPRDYSMKRVWGPSLKSHFKESELRDVLWDSTGTVMGDVFRIGTSKSYCEETLLEIDEKIGNDTKVIFAHSMGTVWVLELLRRSPERFASIQVVLIGSPCSHIVIRSCLQVRGMLWGLSGRKIAHLFNRDDRICALSQWASHPDYTVPIPIAIPSRRVSEHPAELYLQTDAGQDFLRKTFSPSSSSS